MNGIRKMRKPGIPGIAAGSAIIALGIAGFVFFLVARLSAFAGSLQRFPIPGEAVLELQAGPHTLYWEPDRRLSGWPPFECSVESRATGAGVALSRSWVPSRYSVAGRRGVAVCSFDAPDRGAYRFTVRDPQGRTEPRGNMAVAPGGWRGVLVTVLGCLLILGGSIASGVLMILRAVLRGRRRPIGAP